jgi:hypothetical protein
MSRRTRTILAVFLVLASGVIIALVAVSSGSGPDRGACKNAMREQFTYGMKHPDAPAGTRPAACKGVASADLQRFASEIMQDYMTGSP